MHCCPGTLGCHHMGEIVSTDCLQQFDGSGFGPDSTQGLEWRECDEEFGLGIRVGEHAAVESLACLCDGGVCLQRERFGRAEDLQKVGQLAGEGGQR